MVCPVEPSQSNPNLADSREDIKKENLLVIGTLGKGSFGHVQLVKDKLTGKTYALKVLRCAVSVAAVCVSVFVTCTFCLLIFSRKSFVVDSGLFSSLVCAFRL